ncbi:Latexin [Liparis tanakae]|uniref:Latexin n=1 Tax=Liparis tanakae TaxID=230148 RepID=A0A4Z2IRC8_9TELE|nr:Latexin [Liparis tanakae]
MSTSLLSFPFNQQDVAEEEEAEEDVMATGELNPSHYQAQRAAKVVQHYLNTQYGSPFRLFGLHKVNSGNAEDVADSGRKYQLDISVQEIFSNFLLYLLPLDPPKTTEECSAEVLFPSGDRQRSPEVRASCEELLKVDLTAQEEALFLKYTRNQSLLSAQNLPDSYGHMEPDNKPLWHLAIVASSSVMLNESTENTLYNMAQVADITQLATENEHLKFDCHEIVHWKLLFTWSPPEGVKVLQMEPLPHCNHHGTPPNTN